MNTRIILMKETERVFTFEFWVFKSARSIGIEFLESSAKDLGDLLISHQVTGILSHNRHDLSNDAVQRAVHVSLHSCQSFAHVLVSVGTFGVGCLRFKECITKSFHDFFSFLEKSVQLNNKYAQFHKMNLIQSQDQQVLRS